MYTPENSTTGVYSNNYNHGTLDTSTFPLKPHTYKFPVLSTATPRGLKSCCPVPPKLPRNSPFVVNIMIWCLSVSVTYMMSLESMQIPRGQANWSGLVPPLPMVLRYCPSDVNLSTSCLEQSVTYTIPLVSMATSHGLVQWLLPKEWEGLRSG